MELGRASVHHISFYATSPAVHVLPSRPGHTAIVVGRQGLLGLGTSAPDHHILVGQGDLVACDNTRPLTMQRSSRSAGVVILIVPVPMRPDKRPALLIRADAAGSNVVELMRGFLDRILTSAPMFSAAQARHIEAAAMNLAAALAEGQGSSGQTTKPDTQQDQLLAQVLGYIDAKLSDPGMTSGQVAAAHHISVRHLQRLFKAVDSTPSAWIRRCRLEACRRELRDPALRTLSIQEVGVRNGFLLASDFSRAFRGQYGMPPGKFRDEWYEPDADRQ
ncbi:helix-turn-helix transcriptional regulator [Nocardia nova]|uniref:helix-turn-helix transcriptional regulator n=1 Tax=Nocardia nova TaxID=37330 RepID=UPI0006881CAE|nr:helix-turn-helix transcriptional regulator [Nocardia nova]